jgi:hypothetical protein
VTLIYGTIPFEDLQYLSGNLGEEAIMDLTLAAKFGATLVLVESEELSSRLTERFAPHPQEGCGFREWYDSGWTGISSRFMAWCLLGKGTNRFPPDPYPRDVHDFGRCLTFLKCVPEAVPLLPKMADQGPQWKALVENWDTIEKMTLDGREEGATELIQNITNRT